MIDPTGIPDSDATLNATPALPPGRRVHWCTYGFVKRSIQNESNVRELLENRRSQEGPAH